MSPLRTESTGPWPAVTAVTLLALSACHSSSSHRPEASHTATPATSAPPAPPATPATPVVQRMRRLLKLANPLEYAGQTSMAELEAERRSMKGADAPLGDKALAVLREVSPVLGDVREAESHAHLVAAIRLYIELLRLVAQRYPEDLPTQHTIVATMITLPAALGGLDLASEFEPSALRQQALALARELVGRFPRDAVAWSEVGEAAMAVDVVEAMRAFKTCAALDRTIEDCVTRLQELRDDYVRPYCDAGRIRADLAWKSAADQPDPELSLAPPSADVPGPLYVLPTARFGARDVEQIKLRAGGANPEPTPMLRLRPEAEAPFKAWLSELRAQDRFSVLVVGDAPIARGPRGGSVHAGDSWWMLSRVALAELCTSTTHRTLPVDLRAP